MVFSTWMPALLTRCWDRRSAPTAGEDPIDIGRAGDIGGGKRNAAQHRRFRRARAVAAILAPFRENGDVAADSESRR
jgi:hypothetical protein